jgi:hypothetical protein
LCCKINTQQFSKKLKKKRILLIGGTGLTGSLITEALLNQNFEVSILTRDIQKASKLFPQQVHLIKGSMARLFDLEYAMQGKDAVIVNANSSPAKERPQWLAETDGLKNVLTVGHVLSTPCIALVSSHIMHYYNPILRWWPLEAKKEAASMLRSSQLPYVIFERSALFEDLVTIHRKGDRIVHLGKSEYPRYYMSGKEFAAQIAAYFTLDRCGRSDEFVMQGSKAYTISEAIDTFISNCKHTQFKRFNLSYKLASMLAKVDETVHSRLMLSKIINEYPEEFLAQPTWDILGKPSMSLETFAMYYRGESEAEKQLREKYDVCLS